MAVSGGGPAAPTDLYASGILKPQGGDSGGAEQMDLIEFLTKAAGDKVGMAAKLSGGLFPNMAQLGQIAITQGIDSKGVADGKIPSLLNQIGHEGGVLFRAFKMLFSDGSIKDQTGGVGGELHAGGGYSGGSYTVGDVGNERTGQLVPSAVASAISATVDLGH